MKRKSLLCLILAMLFLVSVMAACSTESTTTADSGGQETTTDSDGQETTADGSDDTSFEETIELEWLTTGDQGAKPLLPEDRIVSAINDKFNIELKYNLVPQGDITRINVVMASGNLPDIVTGAHASAATMQWMSDGLLFPLNDHLNQFPAAKAWIDTYDWTDYEGHYYGFPFVNQYNSTNATVSFRQDWLDKLGLEVPETLDDFYEVLKAFTEDDPNETGNNDTYGITSTRPVGNFNFVFYAYGRPYADYSLDAEGNPIPHSEHESFKPGMEYLRKLWDEGLIDPEFMLNDTTMMEEKFYEGRAGYMTSALFRHVNRLESNLQAVSPEGKLGYSLPPKGPDGSFGFAPVGKTGMFTAITHQAEDPIRALAFLDFMVSDEGGDLLRLGIEGVHFDYSGDEVVYNLEEREADNFADNGWCHPLAWGTFFWPLESNFLPHTEPQKDRAIESVEIATQAQIANLVERVPEMQIEYGQIVEDIYNQYFIDMLVGDMDIDEGIERLNDRWMNQGGDKIIEEVASILGE